MRPGNRDDAQRRAMFANMNRQFRVTGPSSRAQRNRAILASGAGAIAVGGYLLARNRSALLRALVTERGGLQNVKNIHRRDKYHWWSATRELEPDEATLAHGPFARMLGKERVGDKDYIESVPWITRKGHELLDAEVKRPAHLMLDADAAPTMRRRDKYADWVERNATIWRALGKNRVYDLLTSAEEATKQAGRRVVTKGRRYLTDPPIPKDVLDQAASDYRRAHRAEMKSMLPRVYESLEEGQLTKNVRGDAARILRDYARRQAALNLESKYPSRVRQLADRVIDPALKRVRSANDRINRRAIDWGRRRGFPVDE